MPHRSHSERLRSFAALIEPIARLLDKETKDKSANSSNISRDTADTQPHSRNAQSSGMLPDSQADGDSSSFFKPGHQKQTSQPASLPMALGGNSAGESNRRFELVRQELIQHQHSQFALLPFKTQMMAKIGGLLYAERMSLAERAYHFVCDGQMIGMLDRKRERLYVREDSSMQDFSDLHCVARPDSAARAIAGFESAQIQDCVWMYAAHDPEALLDLPPEAGTHLLSLRRLPKVSTHLLADSQMILIRQLLMRPQSFDQLSEGMTRSKFRNLMRDMACMLLTRSIEFTTLAPPRGTDKPETYRVVTR
jgi:hypothetical protein